MEPTDGLSTFSNPWESGTDRIIRRLNLLEEKIISQMNSLEPDEENEDGLIEESPFKRAMNKARDDLRGFDIAMLHVKIMRYERLLLESYDTLKYEKFGEESKDLAKRISEEVLK